MAQPLDENRIRQIIQDEIKRNESSGRFGFKNIPFHTHNNVDSPSVFLPTITYTGFIPSDVSLSGATTNGFIFIPEGWTASLDIANIYEVTHNLNTDYYTVSASLYGPEAPNALVPNIICLPNSFTILWQDYLLVSYQADFSFQLVQINNRNKAFPLYKAQGGT